MLWKEKKEYTMIKYLPVNWITHMNEFLEIHNIPKVNLEEVTNQNRHN